MQTKTLIHVDNQGTPMIILLRKCLFWKPSLLVLLLRNWFWNIHWNVSLRIQVLAPGGQELQINIVIFHCFQGVGFVVCIFQSPSKRIFLSRAVFFVTLIYGGKHRPQDPEPSKTPNLLAQVFWPNKFRGPKGLRFSPQLATQGVYHFFHRNFQAAPPLGDMFRPENWLKQHGDTTI